MGLAIVLLLAAALSILIRYLLFDEEYNPKFKVKKKESKYAVKKAQKVSNLESLIRDSGTTITVKKFRQTQMLVGIGVGIFCGFMSGWIFGFIPGYMIGALISVYPLKAAARYKNGVWDEQIIMFTQGMVQEIPLNSGSITASMKEASSIIEAPLRPALYEIIAAYTSSDLAKLEDGFVALEQKTSKKAFKTIADAIRTGNEIGSTAAADSFRHLYDILRAERTDTIERQKAVGQLSVFVKIFAAIAFFAPLVMMLAFSSVLSTAMEGLATKICITIGYIMVYTILVVTQKLESTDDIA
ncbi:hypothetical protein D3C78_18290 [compost metagenome]